MPLAVAAHPLIEYLEVVGGRDLIVLDSPQEAYRYLVQVRETLPAGVLARQRVDSVEIYIDAPVRKGS